MGLFDFLKPKKQPEAKPETPYLGDLEKTDRLFHLLQIPPEQRDEKWQTEFLEHIPLASFRCGDPQVQTGPDGFPYFELYLPEPNKEFQCYVIDRMKDDFLLDSGFGVVINPGSQSADWVLTYGDILNYHIRKEFYTTDDSFFLQKPGKEILAEQEEVLIAQPSEKLLPAKARKIISGFLELNGVKSPKVLLMSRKLPDGKGVSSDIVFNVTPEDFNNESLYRSVMQSIGWYLPRHYTYIGVDEKMFSKGFLPL